VDRDDFSPVQTLQAFCEISDAVAVLIRNRFDIDLDHSHEVVYCVGLLGSGGPVLRSG